MQKIVLLQIVEEKKDIEMNTTYQRTSPEDALWTLYRQQTLKVRHAFLSRVKREDIEACEAFQMHGLYSREEIMEVSKQRMRDIISGQERTISHEEAMLLADNAIADVV